MRAENVLAEWKECRDTIGRFDGYLLKIRLLGVSVFTLLFTAITGVVAKDVVFESVSRSAFMYALIALLLFVATIYILDRYYERLLLVAVLRASRLEAHQFEGFKVGLTTEIEFQKDQLHKPHWWARFSRAALMVNLAYGFMLAIVVVEYVAITWPAIATVKGLVDSVSFIVSIVAVVLIFSISNLLLREPNELIARRSRVVSSPVVMSKSEIDLSIDNVSSDIAEWIASSGIGVVNVVSILTGARPFTDGVVERISKKCPGVEVRLFPVRVRATKNNALEGVAEICYGGISRDMLGGRATLILDDLVDSGGSLRLVRAVVSSVGVVNIRTAVLINKFRGRQEADFVGFDLSLSKEELLDNGVCDYWIFGFGMDIDGSYREMDHIGWVPQLTANKKK